MPHIKLLMVFAFGGVGKGNGTGNDGQMGC